MHDVCENMRTRYILCSSCSTAINSPFKRLATKIGPSVESNAACFSYESRRPAGKDKFLAPFIVVLHL